MSAPVSATGRGSTSLASGDLLGSCRLDRQVGEGAVGAVWRARHEGLGIEVAVKVLKPRTAADDHRYRERFRREAQVAARLDHPGIVRVLDCGEWHGIPFMVMEYVDGCTLDQYLRRVKGPVPEATVLKVLAAAGGALAAAHQAGIIHRDLKPANIMLTRKGALKIADLGLARGLEHSSLTQEQVAVGTPAYMAPECFQPGACPDHRIDIYGLGVIGYQMIYGRLPYQGSVTEIVQGHLGGQAAFSSVSGRGRRTIALVRGLMAVDRDRRPASAATVAIQARAMLGDTARSAAGNDSDFSSMARFIEDRLAASTSRVDGRTIVHTTGQERRLVWLILAAVVAVAVAGLLLGRH